MDFKSFKEFFEQAAEEDYKRRQEKKKEVEEHNKEWNRLTKEAHKKGSVIIANERKMTFKEYEEFLLCYFDREHLFILPALWGEIPMHGKAIIDIYISFYKDWVNTRYKKEQIKLFEDGL